MDAQGLKILGGIRFFSKNSNVELIFLLNLFVNSVGLIGVYVIGLELFTTTILSFKSSGLFSSF